MRLWSGLALLASAFLTSAAYAELVEVTNPTGLKIGANVDLLGSTGQGTPAPDRDRFFLREAELTFLAPIDHLFDGVLSVAAHRETEIDPATNVETSELGLEIHEAYIGSTKLIPRSRFRLGQFFLGIGRLNQFHRHDWPFITAPRIHEDLFGEEALMDQGLEYSFLIPTDFYLDLTVGLTNGWGFGKEEGQQYRPKVNTHYARLATYADLGEAGGLQVGLNYLGNKGLNQVDDTPTFDSRKNVYLGLDATYKLKESKLLKFLFQSEFWQRRITKATVDDGKLTRGFYLYPQYGISEEVSFGVRFDFEKNGHFSDPVTLERVNENIWSYVPTLTYKPSEFSTFRAAYSKETNTWAKAGKPWKAEIQSTFILGTHPAHDF